MAYDSNHHGVTMKINHQDPRTVTVGDEVVHNHNVYDVTKVERTPFDNATTIHIFNGTGTFITVSDRDADDGATVAVVA